MTVKQQLIKLAEDKVKSGGYSNFSFRELAKEVGIKSASVHYHFPTKEDMGAEIARLYTRNFMEALSSPEELVAKGKDPIGTYKTLFRRALVEDGKMCLCGLLAAETDALPEKVRQETKRFFISNLTWLCNALRLESDASETDIENTALSLLAQLEGAMLVSKSLDDNQIFDRIIA